MTWTCIEVAYTGDQDVWLLKVPSLKVIDYKPINNLTLLISKSRKLLFRIISAGVSFSLYSAIVSPGKMMFVLPVGVKLCIEILCLYICAPPFYISSCTRTGFSQRLTTSFLIIFLV